MQYSCHVKELRGSDPSVPSCWGFSGLLVMSAASLYLQIMQFLYVEFFKLGFSSFW